MAGFSSIILLYISSSNDHVHRLSLAFFFAECVRCRHDSVDVPRKVTRTELHGQYVDRSPNMTQICWELLWYNPGKYIQFLFIYIYKMNIVWCSRHHEKSQSIGREQVVSCSFSKQAKPGGGSKQLYIYILCMLYHAISHNIPVMLWVS